MERGSALGGRFVLGPVAGSGGMGVVHRATDEETGWDVAVKLLHPTGDAGRARFEREAEVLASLEHEAIVGYVAHGATPEGRLYLVTEWVDGESLADTLARGALRVSEALTVGRRVASALAAAHARGIVHRDVKPSNVLLPGGEAARATLIDFGIARASVLARSTQTGMVLGTPGYMAPEQARGELHVDGRADLFSLGCVLYEALAGIPPFDGEHLMAILAKILLQPAAPLARARPGPRSLADLVARMLGKTPDERPASARDVRSALEGIEVDPAADAPPSRAMDMPDSLVAEARLASVVIVSDPSAPQASRDAAAAHAAPDRPTVHLRDGIPELVASFDGSLEMLADGSLLVVFSPGGAATDQAVLAARCAVELRKRAPAGAVVTLGTGRGRHHERRPVSEAIDRAVALARGVADDRAVWIDEVTAGLLRASWEVVEDRGAHRIAGARSEADHAHRLLGKPTPFVGRARELRTLHNEIASAFEEPEATAVVLKAPAGVGKTRLRAELLRSLEREGRTGPGGDCDVWTARGDTTMRASPLWVIAELVRGAAHVVPEEGAARARRRVWDLVEGCVPEADVPLVAAFLAEVADLPFPAGDEPRRPPRGAPAEPEPAPEPVPARLAEVTPQLLAARRDPVLLGDQMQRAFEDFVAARCARRPLLVVIEDLHWVDAPSVRFLDAALRQAKRAPLCIVALGRPEIDEVFPRLWADRRLVEMRLRELGDRAAEELARAVLGDAAGPDTLSAIVSRAAGNALCLEELIRAAASGRPEDLPPTVLAIAQARLAKLDPPLRRVLRAASVIGEVFWRGAVTELLGGEARAPEVPGALRELTEREVIEREPASRFAQEAQYTFRHAILRDAAYALLTDEDRARAHAAAADWLAARGESDARVIANHLSLAGRSEQAPRWLLRAAEQALEAGDLAATSALCEHGLEVLDRVAAAASAAASAPTLAAPAAAHDATAAMPVLASLSTPPESNSASIRSPDSTLVRSSRAPARAARHATLTGPTAHLSGALHLLLAEAQRWRGDFAACERAARAAVELLPRDSRPWLRAVEEALVSSGRRGDAPAVRALAELAAASAAHPDARGARLASLCTAARHFLHEGNLAEADAWIERAAVAAAELGESEPRVLAEMFRVEGARARQTGDPVADHRAYGAALAELLRAGDTRAACNARTSYGFSCIQLGAYDDAERELTLALANAERMGITAVRVRALQNLGLVHLARGDHARALALEDEVIAACREQGNTRFEAWTRIYAALIAERAGDHERALREIDAALPELSGAPSAIAGALAVQSRAFLRAGDLAAARAKSAASLELLERLGGIEEFEPLVRVAYAESHGPDDPRAARVAREGAARLAHHAAHLPDDPARAAYLEGIEIHRDLRALALASSG
ncbi:MAG: protein kinase [Polyangiaceae bacterium]